MWFTETPWPPFLICAIISAGLFGQWVLQRRPRLLAGSAVFLALGFLIVLVERLIITETERVESAVHGLVSAFEAGDGARCADFFSNQDQADREIVRRAASEIKIEGGVRISDLAVKMSSAESRAVTPFRASATASYQGHQDRVWTRWELAWQREGSEWKVVRVRRLQLLGDQELSPLSLQE